MNMNLYKKLVLTSMLALASITNSMSANAEGKVADGNAQSIRQQLQRYEHALNSADTDAVMQLYANDAVFMPQHSLPAEGRPAVRLAYENVFKTIKLDIHFEIDEVKVLDKDWAYARTRSNGTVKFLGNASAPIAEGNQELFLLHKESDGVWRFSRYIFSSTITRK